jgi:hypothetical protein
MRGRDLGSFLDVEFILDDGEAEGDIREPICWGVPNLPFGCSLFFGYPPTCNNGLKLKED